MLRLLIAIAGGTLGWWIGILFGITLGAPIAVFVNPIAGRVIGGLFAGLVAGAIEARSLPKARGKRLRFATASALATAIAALALIDIQVMPWLVGGLFGATVALAQAVALGLPRRDVVLRAATSAAGWSLGFLVLRDGGGYSKLGVLGPAVAAVLLAAASAASRDELVRGAAARCA